MHIDKVMEICTIACNYKTGIKKEWGRGRIYNTIVLAEVEKAGGQEEKEVGRVKVERHDCFSRTPSLRVMFLCNLNDEIVILYK